MNTIELIIGNKNYSSWSLRPWILLKNKGIPFEETRIPLYQEGSHEKLLKYSETALVPVAIIGGTRVWDSLAICETVAELFPEKQCWPRDPGQRATARSVSAEMHSGFVTLRNMLPMNCRQSMVFSPIGEKLQADINRIQNVWSICRERNRGGGDFLFGGFSIADAMFAPVVMRFKSYGIEVGDAARDYMANMLALPELKEWIAAGQAEVERVAHYDAID